MLVQIDIAIPVGGDRSGFKMLGAVKLNDETSLKTAKIHDIRTNDLLPIDRDRKRLQKIIPKTAFLFRHVSAEKTGIFCKKGVAVIHRCS